ncbi:MAG: hypothetical protein KJ971_00910 [Firmicutes bacterium]|nr:hypothetical protein [Bacillota bacterium]
MILGDVNHLTVLRETDISYLLTDGVEEVFLHKKEALKPYMDGEEIDVFIYSDNQGRKTASTKEAKISIHKGAFLEVVSINHEYGVFLHYGLVKDLLLSKDDLPLNLNQWPVVGDYLFVSMKEKKSHLFAKIVGRKQISEYVAPLKPMTVGDVCQATVLYLLDDGLVCFTEFGHEIFVHYNNTRQKYRIGEPVRPKLLKQNENDEYVGSLIEQKELMIDVDGKTILTYLEFHQGMMRFTDKSSPDEIASAFKMSKSAFKRALGSLYKAGLVELKTDHTILKK